MISEPLHFWHPWQDMKQTVFLPSLLALWGSSVCGYLTYFSLFTSTFPKVWMMVMLPPTTSTHSHAWAQRDGVCLILVVLPCTLTVLCKPGNGGGESPQALSYTTDSIQGQLFILARALELQGNESQARKTRLLTLSHSKITFNSSGFKTCSSKIVCTGTRCRCPSI